MNTINKLNPYLKFIVSLIPPLATALGAEYGHATWYPFVAACIASGLVFLAPNTPAVPAATPAKVTNTPTVMITNTPGTGVGVTAPTPVYTPEQPKLPTTNTGEFS